MESRLKGGAVHAEESTLLQPPGEVEMLALYKPLKWTHLVEIFDPLIFDFFAAERSLNKVAGNWIAIKDA